ncbi:MAG TPA: YetF domain-containing protein [Fodinibius sp.]|nr:YetF domain-containing protein [Fodinibius sp.]
MDFSWIYTSWSAALMVVISSLGIYVALIFLTRIAGLRSFSKMSSFDFAITIAFGAIIGTTILAKDPPLLRAIVGLASLYIIQFLVATLRGRSNLMKLLVNNEPLLLMKGTDMVEDNLKKAKVTHSDIRAKLREANVTQLSQVKAVVMETTGDIAVLHHRDPSHKLDDILLKEVRGWHT